MKRIKTTLVTPNIKVVTIKTKAGAFVTATFFKNWRGPLVIERGIRRKAKAMADHRSVVHSMIDAGVVRTSA